MTIDEAKKVFFANADRFEQKKIELTETQLVKIKELSGVRQRNKNPQIWQAFKKDKLSGWVVIDDVIGKHEFITYAAALSTEGTVLGVEILTYRETHGGAVRKPEWRAHFKGKHLSDKFKLDEDVPNISGATLSCRNILDGVKRLLVLQQVIGNG